MALISPKNFITPFTNRVHIGTIIFAVLLFAAFRAMGGAFHARAVMPKAMSTERGIRFLDQAPPETDQAGEDVVDEELANHRSDRRANVDTGTSSSTSSNDLTEILRRLDKR